MPMILTNKQQKKLDGQLKKLAWEEIINKEKFYSLIAQGANWENMLLQQYVLEDFELVKSLYEIDSEIFAKALKARGKYGETPLLKALKYNVNKLIEVINFLQEKGADMTAHNEYNINILHYAVVINNLELIKWLYGIKPSEFLSMLNTRDESGITPFLTAAYFYCDIEILKFLVEKAPTIIAISSKGETILHMPIVLNNLEFIIWLGDNYPEGFKEILNSKDDEGRTPLLKAVLPHESFSYFNPEVIKYLILQGANIGEKNNVGNTIFHSPEIYKHLDLLEWIFENYSDQCNAIIDQRNDVGDFPLIITEKVSLEAVLFLLKHGADLTTKDDDMFMTILGKKSILENPGILKSIRDINKESFDEAIGMDSLKGTLLELASDAGFKASVEFLLDYQGLDFRYDNGDSILHKTFAVSLGKELIISFQKEDPHTFANILSLKNHSYSTPLIEAIELMHNIKASDTVKLFLKLGAAIPVIKDVKITSSHNYRTITKKLLEATIVADNILAKLEYPILIAPGEIHLIEADVYEIVFGRIQNKWKLEGCDPELASYIFHSDFIPKELKTMFLESTKLHDLKEVDSKIEVIPGAASEWIPEKEEANIATEVILSQFVTVSAWARREAALKAFGAKWHDIIAEREANAIAAAEAADEDSVDEMESSGEPPASAPSFSDVDIGSASTSTIDTTTHMVPVCLGEDSLTTAIDS